MHYIKAFYDPTLWYFVWGRGWLMKGFPYKPVHLEKTIQDPFQASDLERSWIRNANKIGRRTADGRHHQGMHYLTMITREPSDLYLKGVKKITHFKFSPRNILCLIMYEVEWKEKTKRWWKLYLHHEGHCPGCKPNKKLNRRTKFLNRRQKLLRRSK